MSFSHHNSHEPRSWEAVKPGKPHSSIGRMVAAAIQYKPGNPEGMMPQSNSIQPLYQAPPPQRLTAHNVSLHERNQEQRTSNVWVPSDMPFTTQTMSLNKPAVRHSSVERSRPVTSSLTANKVRAELFQRGARAVASPHRVRRHSMVEALVPPEPVRRATTAEPTAPARAKVPPRTRRRSLADVTAKAVEVYQSQQALAATDKRHSTPQRRTSVKAKVVTSHSSKTPQKKHDLLAECLGALSKPAPVAESLPPEPEAAVEQFHVEAEQPKSPPLSEEDEAAEEEQPPDDSAFFAHVAAVWGITHIHNIDRFRLPLHDANLFDPDVMTQFRKKDPFETTASHAKGEELAAVSHQMGIRLSTKRQEIMSLLFDARRFTLRDLCVWFHNNRWRFNTSRELPDLTDVLFERWYFDPVTLTAELSML